MVQWIMAHCPKAAGLWTDSVVAPVAKPNGPKLSCAAQAVAAKELWRDVTCARAMVKWTGLYFGRVRTGMPPYAGRFKDDFEDTLTPFSGDELHATFSCPLYTFFAPNF